MFETDDRPGCVIGLLPSALRFVGQLVLCYPATLLVGAPFSFVLSRCGLSGEHPSNVYFAGYQALICFSIAPIIGWYAGRLVPALVSTGRWIWVAPAILLLWDIVASEFPHRLPEYLFATGGNEGLGVFLLTLPACSATGYSLGMAFASMLGAWARATWPRVVMLALSALAVFALFAWFLHSFERSRLDHWSRVRMVIPSSGLAFSQDVGLVCLNPANPPGAIHLTKGTDVESLELRACKGGRLVDGETTPDAFVLERVRVLTGPHAGLEGWISSDGLGGPF